MYKVYKEDPEFWEYSIFDTETGRLSEITRDEFALIKQQGMTGRLGNNYPRAVTVFEKETSPTHTMFPRRIYMQITRKCNIGCDYCFIKADEKGSHVPTEHVFRIGQHMADQGLMEVRLTGGEPTLHPDFFEIMRFFKANNIYVSVATNGVWSKNTLDSLCEEEKMWIICSLDGNRETHNRFRRGTYDTVIKNLHTLKERNPAVRIRLNTVLTKINMDQVFELAELCKSLKTESITIIPMRPSVRDTSALQHMVDAKEFKYVLEQLLKAKQKYGINFTSTIEGEYIDVMFRDPVFRKKSSCSAGREGTNLDYNPTTEQFLVYACSLSPAPDLDMPIEIRKPLVAGEFSPDDPEKLTEIWHDESRWTLFRDLSNKSDYCKPCEFYQSHVCTGSCPVQNIDYGALDIDKNMLKQFSDQLQSKYEWYCYKQFGLTLNASDS